MCSVDDLGARVLRRPEAVQSRLQVLQDLGLGYLTLGEETPSLSGGEAQRLKLASEMGRGQSESVFVFDEPTIGLHPLDVQTLLGVFRRLIANGATVVVIEHDLDVIRSADYIIDMGPGGGEEGGRIVACGTPEEERWPDTAIIFLTGYAQYAVEAFAVRATGYLLKPVTRLAADVFSSGAADSPMTASSFGPLATTTFLWRKSHRLSNGQMQGTAGLSGGQSRAA